MKRGLEMVAAGMLAAAAACAPSGDAVVMFNYGLFGGAAQALAPLDCAGAGVATVRFLIGVDRDGDRRLADGEVVAAAHERCEQLDIDWDEDGVADDHVGVFGRTNEFTPELGPTEKTTAIPPGTYDLWAVELLDAGGRAVAWRHPRSDELATRITFGMADGVDGTVMAPDPITIEPGEVLGFGLWEEEPDGTWVTRGVQAILP